MFVCLHPAKAMLMIEIYYRWNGLHRIIQVEWPKLNLWELLVRGNFDPKTNYIYCRLVRDL